MIRFITLVASVTVVLLLGGTTYDANAQNVPCSRTYTANADFDLGYLINVNHDSPNNNRLQLNDVVTPPPYVWVACSGRGTAVRIDVETGAILGEYWTSHASLGRSPSRTAVDQYGNVWIGNRNDADVGMGSVVKIGVVIGGERCNADGTLNPTGEYLKPPFQYCTAVDRNGDGLIRTSRGLGDKLAWSNAGGVDTDGGVETAEDECIILYVRTLGTNVQTVAVDANNDVWIGGYGNRVHEHLDGETGASLGSFSPGAGAFGGLIDGNGILWSASNIPGKLLRADVTAVTPTYSTINIGWYSCGLGIDGDGNIYTTTFTINSVVKLSPAGAYMGTISTYGANGDRGVAITPDDHIWVANSYGNNVSHLDETGSLIKVITVGTGPTGVAVDAHGKMWVTNTGSNSVSRIDPTLDDGKGDVDLTVNLGAGAAPFNYSNMTGAMVLGVTTWSGSWTFTQAGVDANTEWGTVSWNETVPEGTSIKVEARTGSNPWQDISSYNGIALCGTENALVGASLTVRVTLFGNPESDVSPVLEDLTIALCDDVDPVLTLNPDVAMWPPNRDYATFTAAGMVASVSDNCNTELTSADVYIISASSDEPENAIGNGDGNTVDDILIAEDCKSIMLRRERAGGLNGRVYTITLQVDDGNGNSTTADFQVQVTHDMAGNPAIDDGVASGYAVTSLCSGAAKRSGNVSAGPEVCTLEQNYPNPFNPTTSIRYSIAEADHVSLKVYDIFGREIAVLVDGPMRAGSHEVPFDGSSVASGTYVYILTTNGRTLLRRLSLVK